MGLHGENFPRRVAKEGAQHEQERVTRYSKTIYERRRNILETKGGVCVGTNKKSDATTTKTRLVSVDTQQCTAGVLGYIEMAALSLGTWLGAERYPLALTLF